MIGYDASDKKGVSFADDNGGDLIAAPAPRPKSADGGTKTSAPRSAAASTSSRYQGISSQDLRSARGNLRNTGVGGRSSIGPRLGGSSNIQSDRLPFEGHRGSHTVRLKRVGQEKDALLPCIKQKVTYRDMVAQASRNKLEFKFTPTDGIWQTQELAFDIDIPNDYPFVPPEVYATKRLYHPNFDLMGRPSLEVLKQWTPVYSLNDICIAIMFLFVEPIIANSDLIANDEAAELLVADPAGFASKTIDVILCRLEVGIDGGGSEAARAAKLGTA